MTSTGKRCSAGGLANLSVGWVMFRRFATGCVLPTNTYARGVLRSIPSAPLPTPHRKYNLSAGCVGLSEPLMQQGWESGSLNVAFATGSGSRPSCTPGSSASRLPSGARRRRPRCNGLTLPTISVITIRCIWFTISIDCQETARPPFAVSSTCLCTLNCVPPVARDNGILRTRNRLRTFVTINNGSAITAGHRAEKCGRKVTLADRQTGRLMAI